MIALIILLALAVAAAAYFFLSLRQSRRDIAELRVKAASVLDVVAERERVQEQAMQLKRDRENSRAEITSLQEKSRVEIAGLQESARNEAAGIRSKAQAEIAVLQEKSRVDQEKLHKEWEVTLGQIQDLKAKLKTLRLEESTLEESADLRAFGFYKPRYDFPNAARYSAELERVRSRQKAMIQAKTAAISHIAWTVNGSAAEGRKQINQTLRLLLRAFNGECDAAIARVKYNNAATMEIRIEKACEAINKLAGVQSCVIAPEYLALKLDELHLAHEHQEKLWEEKEEQRQIREMMREEETAQRELDRAREDAEKEEQRYQQALARARQDVEAAIGEKQKKLLYNIVELERLLAEAQERKARAISRAQMTRSGHVYIISNIGSFGEDVFKIGMTRRLDPMDRVRELGDASVPFAFDVHAILFSDDAPSLENALHKAFHRRRVNLVNQRKEYFITTIDEIETVAKAHGATVEFVKTPEAKEFRLSHSQRSQQPTQETSRGWSSRSIPISGSGASN